MPQVLRLMPADAVNRRRVGQAHRVDIKANLVGRDETGAAVGKNLVEIHTVIREAKAAIGAVIDDAQPNGVARFDTDDTARRRTIRSRAIKIVDVLLATEACG